MDYNRLETSEKDNETELRAADNYLSIALNVRQSIFTSIEDVTLEESQKIISMIKEYDKMVLTRPLSSDTIYQYLTNLNGAYEMLNAIPKVSDIIEHTYGTESALKVIASRILDVIDNINGCMVLAKIAKYTGETDSKGHPIYKSGKTYAAKVRKPNTRKCTPEVIVELILPAKLDKASCIIINDIMIPDYHYLSDVRWTCGKALVALLKYSMDCQSIADKEICKSAPKLFSVALSSEIVSYYDMIDKRIIPFNKILTRPNGYVIKIDDEALDLQFIAEQDDAYYPDLVIDTDKSERVRIS